MHLVLYSLIIFSVALISGWIALKSVSIGKKTLTFFLTFSGAYLFSITIVHILPEVFTSTNNIHYAGIFVLAGFFLQQTLEFFSSGVEHGHMHKEKSDRGDGFLWTVTIALFIHSFLEGTLLTDSHGDSIFLGIVIHKAPAAFALASVLLSNTKKSKLIYSLLFVFAIASPLGMIFGDLFFTPAIQPLLFGLVAGSFLQISTTIVFESSADHRFNLLKMTFSIAGALLAIASELFFL